MFAAQASYRPSSTPVVVVSALAVGLWTWVGPVLADKPIDEHANRVAKANELLDRLQISRPQALQIIPVFERAAARWTEYYRQREDLQPALVETLQAFLAEDQRDTGFSDQVERDTAGLHHRDIATRDELNADLQELESNLLDLLTPQQQRLLDAAERRTPRQAVRGGRSEHQARQAALGALEQARDELADLYSQMHPRLGPLGDQLLHPAAAAVLYPLAGVNPSPQAQDDLFVYAHGTPSYSAAQREADAQTIRQLSQQINLWNLVNGLHLTAEQAEHIAQLATLAADLNGSDRSPRRGRPRTCRPYTMVELEQGLMETLTDTQQQVLADYQPCLIPPKNLKDPVRVGQANDTSPAVALLERARRAPAARLDHMVDEVLQREQQHVGTYSSQEYQARRNALLEAIRAVRGMDDVEFAVSKEDLAAQLQPPDRKRELQTRVDELASAAGVPGRAAHFLLQPDMIAVLQQRAAQLRQRPSDASPDLSRGPQADHCEPGKCAVN
jgi:hypothetical protein